MESIESDEWQLVKNTDQKKARALAAARNILKKDKRINLRLTQKDYHQIQTKAIEEGITYQTLISSLVHKYLNGSFGRLSAVGYFKGALVSKKGLISNKVADEIFGYERSLANYPQRLRIGLSLKTLYCKGPSPNLAPDSVKTPYFEILKVVTY